MQSQLNDFDIFSCPSCYSAYMKPSFPFSFRGRWGIYLHDSFLIGAHKNQQTSLGSKKKMQVRRKPKRDWTLPVWWNWAPWRPPGQRADWLRHTRDISISNYAASAFHPNISKTFPSHLLSPECNRSRHCQSALLLAIGKRSDHDAFSIAFFSFVASIQIHLFVASRLSFACRFASAPFYDTTCKNAQRKGTNSMKKEEENSRISGTPRLLMQV